MRDRHKRTQIAAKIAIAAALALFAVIARSQALKRSDPAKGLPKVGIIAMPPAENFPVETGQKVFTDSDATIELVAPEMVGLNAVRFPRGGRVILGTTADVQLLIGYFRAGSPEWAKPPENQAPAIRNAARISGMPPVDIYLVRFSKNNYKQGAAVEIQGTFAMLGVIPIDLKITSWDAKCNQAR
jgi:hypothetical protein